MNNQKLTRKNISETWERTLNEASVCVCVCVCVGGGGVKSFQSCLTLCNPMDHSLPGSSIQGIHQTRILEWITMPSSRGSYQPRDQTCITLRLLHWQAGFLPLALLGKPSESDQYLKYRISKKD